MKVIFKPVRSFQASYNNNKAGHEILKMHEQNTQQKSHAAITRVAFTQSIMYGKYAKPLCSLGNKIEINNMREYSAKISPEDREFR